MNPMKRTAVAAALSAGLIGGGAAGMILGTPGISGAQETTTTQAPTDGATSDGASTDDRRAAMTEHLASTLAPLVEAGTITQAQADAVIAAIEEAGPPDGGHGGPGMRGGRGGPGLEAAAAAIGISEEELRTALRDGGTLAEVAEANGVDPQAVIDALVAELQTRLDEKVADGDLTQEEADDRLASGTERITERMTATLPERGQGRPEEAPGDGGTSPETPEGQD